MRNFNRKARGTRQMTLEAVAAPSVTVLKKALLFPKHLRSGDLTAPHLYLSGKSEYLALFFS